MVGTASWSGPAALKSLTTEVRRSKPDGVLLAGCYCTGGYEVLQALRRALPRRTRFTASDAMTARWEHFPHPHPATGGL